MKLRVLVGLLVCILCLSCFSGCESSTGLFPSADPEEAPAPSVTLSQDVQIPINRIVSLNPAISSDEDTYFVNKLIYESLFELDDTLTPQPLLAAEYEYSEDGSSLRICLQDNVSWQDGEPLTAADVKFSVEVYQLAGEEGLSLYSGHVAGIRSVTADSDRELTLRFTPDGDRTIAKLTFPILPSHQFKNAKEFLESGKYFTPLGTGAYMVESFDPLKELILTGYGDYRKGAPANRLIFRILPDKDNAAAFFDSHQLNIGFIGSVDRGILLDDLGLQMLSYVSNEAEVIGFNFNNEFLSIRNVRQAIAAGIDRERILNTAYYGNGVFSDTAYFPGIWGTDSSERLTEYNPAVARRLLADIGYTDTDEDGFIEDSDGDTPSRLTILVDGDNESRNLAAQILQENLTAMGIPSKIAALSWEDYQLQLAEGEFDIYLGGYRTDDAGDMRFLYHSAYGNPIGYKNAVLDTLLNRLMSSGTQEEKLETFGDVKDLVAEAMPYYCLLYKTSGVVLAGSFKGSPDPVFNNIYQGCETWSSMYEITEKQTEEPAEQ